MNSYAIDASEQQQRYFKLKGNTALIAGKILLILWYDKIKGRRQFK
jgi:hypothetical protein